MKINCWGEKNEKVFSVIMAILVIMSCFGCSSGVTDGKNDDKVLATVTTNSGETKQMTLQQIKDVEETNSILFENEYIGADITVTSTITKIGGAFKLTSWFDCDAYIELEANDLGCFFKPITEEYATTLNVGDTITVSGKIGMASVTGFDIYIMQDEISPY